MASRPVATSEAGGDTALTVLIKDWKHLTTLEQGKRLLELIRKGYSMRRLADLLDLSDLTIRRRVDLATSNALSKLVR
jgi:DNA-binding NarL/FixJ family response regulator